LVVLLQKQKADLQQENGRLHSILAAHVINVDCGGQLNAVKALGRLHRSALSKKVDPSLLNAVGQVLKGWITKVSDYHRDGKKHPLRAFLNNCRFEEELEEAIAVAHYLITNRRREDGPVVLFDVCCGKGFASMLVAYLAPFVEGLAAVESVVMIDLKLGRRVSAHVEVAQIDADAGLCRPIEMKEANIHDLHFPRDLGLLEPSAPSAVFVGVHLCNRLSARCAELFVELPSTVLLVLSPCCIPRGRTITINKQSLEPSVLVSNREKGKRVDQSSAYDKWVDFLFTALPGKVRSSTDSSSSTDGGGGDDPELAQKQLEKLPLKGGKHRRNCWIAATKQKTELKLPVITSRGNGFLITDMGEICMDFYFKGGCRYKKRCRFNHVRGQAL
jgi:hypothetical protein